jgi:hypothetical protein
MKNLSLSLILFLISFVAFPQSTNEKVTIDKSQLTQQQLMELELQSQTKKLEEYAQWAGVGNEVGIAIREGLMAVVDVSEKFGETKVGQFTMFMIAWKLVGESVITIIIGVVIFTLFTIFMFRSYRHKFMIQRVRKKGHWLKFWGEHEFEIIEPERYEGFEVVRIVYIVIFFIGMFLSYAIMTNAF